MPSISPAIALIVSPVAVGWPICGRGQTRTVALSHEEARTALSALQGGTHDAIGQCHAYAGADRV